MMFRKFYWLLLLWIVSITGFFSIASADLSTELTLWLEAYYSFDDTRLNWYVFTQEEDYDLNLVNYTSGWSFIEWIIDNWIYLWSWEGISHAANFPMNWSASYAFWFKDIQWFAFIMWSYTSSNGANRPLIRMNESYVSFDWMDYDPVLYYTGSSDWQHIVINMSNYCKSIILNGKNLQSVCHSSWQPWYWRFSYLTYEKIYLGTSFQAWNPSLFADTTPQWSFDELRVYNRGLSVDEALELYEQGRPSDYGVCGLTGDVELFDASDTCLAWILTWLVYSWNAATPSWT